VRDGIDLARAVREQRQACDSPDNCDLDNIVEIVVSPIPPVYKHFRRVLSVLGLHQKQVYKYLPQSTAGDFSTQSAGFARTIAPTMRAKEAVRRALRLRHGLVTLLLIGMTACGQSARVVVLSGHGSISQVSIQPIVASRLVLEPDDGVHLLTRAIDHAQHSILVESYIVSDSSIVRALERAEAQDVRVFVILERHPLGLGLQPEHMRSELSAAGIAVRWAPSAFRLMHAKFLVFDDRLAVISTANLSRSAFTRNREFLVETARPSEVHEISNLFRRDWNRLPEVPRDPPLLVSPRNARVKMEALLMHAHKHIEIYAEELADAEVERLLIAKVRAGVRIRLLLPRGASPLDAAYVSQHGVETKTLVFPYVHAKVVLVDGRLAYVGSENLSSSSLDQNRELGILLRGASLERIASTFESDWAHAKH
jgi:cardiolipin synthase A/B